MFIKKLLVFAEKWGLPILVVCTVAAFGLAVGEQLRPEPGDDAVNLWSAMLNTATSESDSAEGWAKRMHLLVNLTLGWAVTRIYMATAGLKWDNFAARYLARSHVIIVAGKAGGNPDSQVAPSSRNALGQQVDKSALAIELALSMVAARPVVLSLKSVDEGDRSKLWEAGVTLLTEDIAMADILTATGANRASMLIAMRDHYGDNIALTRAALSPSLDNTAVECKCLIEPLSVKRSLQLEDYFEADSLSRIRVFNESELIARRLVKDHPPDAPIATNDEGAVHVLLVGLGSVGQSILLQLARLGHYRSGKKTKVTAIDRNVKQQWRAVLEAHPQLELLLSVETQELRVEAVSLSDLDRWLFDERPITIVYVCTKDEIVNLRIARLLLKGMQARESAGHGIAADVVVLDPPGGCVLSEYATHGEHQGRFHLFSLVHGTAGRLATSNTSPNLMSDVDDVRARQFHEDYCSKVSLEYEKNPGSQKKPFNLSWADLPETARDANRCTADHFDVKMRAIGCRVVHKEGLGEPAVLNLHELEMLARMEHERWSADRALDGWTFAPVRNNSKKLHPNLLPYDDLTEPIKQLDRDSVLQMVQILAQEGFVGVRYKVDP